VRKVRNIAENGVEETLQATFLQEYDVTSGTSPCHYEILAVRASL